MKTIVGEGVDRLNVLPQGKGGGGVPVLPAGKKPGTDLAGTPVRFTISVISLPTIARAVYKSIRVLGTGIDEWIPVMEALNLLLIPRLLKDAKGIKGCLLYTSPSPRD